MASLVKFRTLFAFSLYPAGLARIFIQTEMFLYVPIIYTPTTVSKAYGVFRSCEFMHKQSVRGSMK